MDGGLEAAHVLHGHALPIARLQVLVQDGDDLVIEDLELANSLYHLLQRLQQLTHWDFHISSVNHSKLLTTYAISLTQLLKQQIRLAFKQISLLVSCCQLDFLACTTYRRAGVLGEGRRGGQGLESMDDPVSGDRPGPSVTQVSECGSRGQVALTDRPARAHAHRHVRKAPALLWADAGGTAEPRRPGRVPPAAVIDTPRSRTLH